VGTPESWHTVCLISGRELAEGLAKRVGGYYLIWLLSECWKQAVWFPGWTISEEYSKKGRGDLKVKKKDQ